jgi:hypothetical protein
MDAQIERVLGELKRDPSTAFAWKATQHTLTIAVRHEDGTVWSWIGGIEREWQGDEKPRTTRPPRKPSKRPRTVKR